MRPSYISISLAAALVVGCADTAPYRRAPLPQPLRHTVERRGETLSAISAWYTGSAKNWADIARANPGVDERRVRIGDVIKIPAVLVRRRDRMPPTNEPLSAPQEPLAEPAAPITEAAPMGEPVEVLAADTTEPDYSESDHRETEPTPIASPTPTLGVAGAPPALQAAYLAADLAAARALEAHSAAVSAQRKIEDALRSMEPLD